MNATISCSLQDFAKVLKKAQIYTKSEDLQEKLTLDNITQEEIREHLADENYFSIQHMLCFLPHELRTTLKAVSHILGVSVEGIAFVNEFDSDGTAYAMVHLTTTINLK